MSWATRFAILAAFFLAWGAAKGGAEGAPAWQVIAHRALDRLLLLPRPWGVAPAFRYFVETLAPLLGVVALVRRREMPAIAGAFALLLIARSTPDIPLCSLGLALAALSAVLASKDDRGMWAVLLSKP